MSSREIKSNPPNRVYWQYRDKPRFQALINIGLQSGSSMSADLNVIKNCYDVNTAKGNCLDVIGEIVNYRRPTALDHSVVPEYFVGGEIVGAGSSFNLANPTVFTPMDDERYRMLLKVKISKNSTYCTMDDIADAIQFITDVPVQVINHGDMTFSLTFLDALTNTQRELIRDYDVIPEPLGVTCIGITENPNISMIGRSNVGSEMFSEQIN